MTYLTLLSCGTFTINLTLSQPWKLEFFRLLREEIFFCVKIFTVLWVKIFDYSTSEEFIDR